jgi:hypothetical protein
MATSVVGLLKAILNNVSFQHTYALLKFLPSFLPFSLPPSLPLFFPPSLPSFLLFFLVKFLFKSFVYPTVKFWAALVSLDSTCLFLWLTLNRPMSHGCFYEKQLQFSI